MRLYAFIDTNVFLHCKDLGALPWNEIGDANEVIVVATRTVRREIDKIKDDPRQPRSKRARYVSSLLSGAAEKPSRTSTLRDSEPAVRLQILSAPKRTREGLDLTASGQDECLVAEIAGFVDEGMTPHVFLSRDGYAVSYAQDHRLEARRPPEGWDLPAEKDTEQVELAELRRTVAEYEARQPKVSADFVSADNSRIITLDMCTNSYEMLTPSDVEAVVDQICRTFPKVTEFGQRAQIAETAQSGEFGELLNVFNKLALGFQNFFPPTEAQIHRYWDEYDEWRNMLLKAIPDFPDRLAEDSRKARLAFTLQNSGTVPAEGVIVEISVPVGFRLYRLRDEKKQEVSLPRPPAAPTSGLVGTGTIGSGYTFDSVARMADTIMLPESAWERQEKSRNVHVLRYVNAFSDGTVVRLACDELRHGVAPAKCDLVLEVVDTSMSRNVVLDYLVSATNLIKPLRGRLPVCSAINQRDMPALDIGSLFREDT